jgi:mannosylglycerate hydrolase
MKLYLISHTHWDREWYQDFQSYRYRLVRMMDDLINILECDAQYNLHEYKCTGKSILVISN